LISNKTVVPIFLFELDIDAGEQEVSGPGQLERKARLPGLNGKARARGWLHPTSEKRRLCRQLADLAFANGLQTLRYNLFPRRP
jgi:hypothetical protein